MLTGLGEEGYNRDYMNLTVIWERGHGVSIRMVPVQVRSGHSHEIYGEGHWDLPLFFSNILLLSRRTND